MFSSNVGPPVELDAWKERPARRQVDERSLQRAIADKTRKESSARNIWTGKAVRGPAGDGLPPGRPARELSMYRCIPQIDCGRTKGSDANQHTFCLYFAKGCCAQGASCIYLHRVPTADDEAYHSKDMGADIFGREKFAEHEGYRKGAGTFERDNRTLYVNYEGAGCYEVPKIRELVYDNFSLWGPIKSIYIVHKKTLAFVRYEWRSSAEFAKEAMHKQKLLGSTQAEILVCRWSNEDPNPVAVVQKKRDYADAFESAAAASWDSLPEEQRQARIFQLQLAASMRHHQAVSEYPDTDAQYGDAYPNTDAQYEQDAAAYPDTDAQYSSYAGDPNSTAAGGTYATLYPPHEGSAGVDAPLQGAGCVQGGDPRSSWPLAPGFSYVDAAACCGSYYYGGYGYDGVYGGAGGDSGGQPHNQGQESTKQEEGNREQGGEGDEGGGLPGLLAGYGSGSDDESEGQEGGDRKSR